MTDPKFTRIVANQLINARDLANWGFETGNTTPEEIRASVVDRRAALPKMIEAGLSQRQCAELFGVSQSMIVKDLAITGCSKGEHQVITRRVAAEKRRKAELEKPIDPGLDPEVHFGDFRKLSHKIADDSVQLVFTDPPYDEESIELYRDAAAVAARILKPGGSFIAYCGHPHLLEVLKACSYHLRYWWTIACVHAGPQALLLRLGIRAGWKPMVWFVKETRGDTQNILSDVVSGGIEKDGHEWQQAQSEAAYYIEKLTTEGGTVIDFFAGAGTTAMAAKELGRKCISFEKNKLSVDYAKRRTG